jgi:hypothetical protein
MASKTPKAPKSAASKKVITPREFIFKVLMYAFLTMAATVVLIPLVSLLSVSLQSAS